ncbi:hypothetical protein [Aliiroseovarius sp. YM-037]|uniref:hypothetical protein n=1 Tax=Aliiroseovarius sp. YM-037 TaxID=3341728 RepID=UPI003A7FCB42
MVRSLPALIAATVFSAGIAQAGAFDGIFRQTAESDCTLIGQDGGALKIEDDVFFGVESQCNMANPTDVRDMDAVLYDMECSGEGTTWIARALFMHAADDGLIMVWNGFAFKYDRCTEGDVVDSAVDSETAE